MEKHFSGSMERGGGVGGLFKDEDSDFVMEEDEESGSDWEASQRC